MGIFSHKDRTPEPQISIHLDEALANSTFQPGSSVHGIVCLQSPTPRQLLRAQVCLSGRITTHSVRKMRHHNSTASAGGTRTVYIRYHDEAQLFNIGQGISGNTTLEPGTQVNSQFSLSFPAGTDVVTGTVPYTRETAPTGVYAVESHALPPSFSHHQSPDDYATIEYRLRVVAYFGERPEPFIHNSIQPLLFSPLQAPHQSGLVEFIRPPQNYVSSRLLGEENSFGKSLRDKLSSKTPSVNLVVKASVSVCVPTTASFTIHTCVEIDGLSHPAISIPNVTISIKSLKLLPVTAWRAWKVERSGHIFGDSPEREVVDEETVRLNAVPGTVSAEQRRFEKGEKLAFAASFEARVPGDACPTFRTLNVNRSYVLKVTMEAEICGKVFEYKFESRIQILSNLTA